MIKFFEKKNVDIVEGKQVIGVKRIGAKRYNKNLRNIFQSTFIEIMAFLIPNFVHKFIGNRSVQCLILKVVSWKIETQ